MEPMTNAFLTASVLAAVATGLPKEVEGGDPGGALQGLLGFRIRGLKNVIG
jgi:hypothetical protein